VEKKPKCLRNRKLINESKRASVIWHCKFYDPNDLENDNKITGVFEEDGSRINRFRKHERSDVNQALFKSFK
jgi:hypothetical protein